MEFLQYYVVPGRDASLSDLLTNTTGAAIAAAALVFTVILAMAPGSAADMTALLDVAPRQPALTPMRGLGRRNVTNLARPQAVFY